MIGLYYSGNDFLVDLVTPRVSNLGEQYAVNGHRELGMLENTQHLLLLLIVIILVRAYRGSSFAIQKAGFVLAAAGVTFILLEELDYGVHYLELLLGEEVYQGNFNLHNQGKNTSVLKSVADLLAVIWFVILPLVSQRIRNPWLNYIAAPPMVVLTVISGLLLSQLAHYCDDIGMAIRPSLSSNISEFREMFTYYLWVLYVWHITHTPWPARHINKPEEPVST